jgi:hypothetical protein
MHLDKHFTSPRLAISLAAALTQGLLLVWLHTRIEQEMWPAAAPEWMGALYAIGVILPITIQLLSEHWRSKLLWSSLIAMGLALFYFGWHFGNLVGAPFPDRPLDQDACFTFGISTALLWLLFLPFLRRRLVTGSWRGAYAELFTLAWQNKIALAEAAAFTGALWLLLFLWAALFRMLGYTVFEHFFEWPGFVYPFTAVAFGVALHLAGSVERIVTVVREQLLGLLKWLAPVAALILALFAPTLLAKLPGLVSSGAKAISAAWLLWLMAVFVLLLNAGYQNGQGERPYPRGLAFALRVVVPAMLLVSLVAMYSLWIRITEYGVTVERVYAVIVALTAIAYSAGYTIAALKRGPWMQGIERVNVLVAAALIVIVALLLTPLASPYRLAASSQARRLAVISNDEERESALRYLRFDAGRYGIRQLEKFVAAKSNPQAIKLGAEARVALELENKWGSPARIIESDALRSIQAFPAGREVEPALRSAIRSALRGRRLEFDSASPAQASLLFVDLNGDEVEEAIFLAEGSWGLFAPRAHGWSVIGWHTMDCRDGRVQRLAVGNHPACDDLAKLRQPLAAGDYHLVDPKWRDLRIGTVLFPVSKAITRED